MSGNDGNKQYRNSVFCSYFNEPTRLLSLCNAILNTNYKDAGKLIINTFDGMFFDDQKNDLAVLEAYHFDKNFSESEIISALMKLYQNLID